jgi:hypothetical protein
VRFIFLLAGYLSYSVFLFLFYRFFFGVFHLGLLQITGRLTGVKV